MCVCVCVSVLQGTDRASSVDEDRIESSFLIGFHHHVLFFREEVETTCPCWVLLAVISSVPSLHIVEGFGEMFDGPGGEPSQFLVISVFVVLCSWSPSPSVRVAFVFFSLPDSWVQL